MGGALALADQLEATGLAKLLAAELMDHFNGAGPWLAFIGIYLFTLVLTELMSNNAAAALAFRITSYNVCYTKLLRGAGCPAPAPSC